MASKRKLRRQQKKGVEKLGHAQIPSSTSQTLYDKRYKLLLLIPFLLLLFGIISLATTYATTGEFFQKGITLAGGYAVTLTPDLADISTVQTVELETHLQETFPEAELLIRSQNSLGERVALEIQVDITDETELLRFQEALLTEFPDLTLETIQQSSSIAGSVLGQNFVRQVFYAMLVAFILMGIVVFIQFKTTIPSLAVILAALSDIVVTLAIINILDIKISSAGIAAFLMLIGYSVDTDIMLSTRVLKSREGSVNERIRRAFKTGLTMNITTLAAVTVALFVSQSAVITQIMTIIFIGLLVDMINTWLQNAGILKWYVERKGVQK